MVGIYVTLSLLSRSSPNTMHIRKGPHKSSFRSTRRWDESALGTSTCRNFWQMCLSYEKKVTQIGSSRVFSGTDSSCSMWFRNVTTWLLLAK